MAIHEQEPKITLGQSDTERLMEGGEVNISPESVKSELTRMTAAYSRRRNGELVGRIKASFKPIRAKNGNGHNGNGRDEQERPSKRNGQENLGRVNEYVLRQPNSEVVYQSRPPPVPEAEVPTDPLSQSLKEVQAMVKEVVDNKEKVEERWEGEIVNELFAPYLKVMDSLRLVDILDRLAKESKMPSCSPSPEEVNDGNLILAKAVVEPVANIGGYPVAYRYLGSDGRLKSINDIVKGPAWENQNGRKFSEEEKVYCGFLAVSLRGGDNGDSYSCALARLGLSPVGDYSLEFFTKRIKRQVPSRLRSVPEYREPDGTSLFHESSGASVFRVEISSGLWDKICQDKAEEKKMAQIKERTAVAMMIAYFNFVEGKASSEKLKEYFAKEEKEGNLLSDEEISFRIGWQS